MSVIIKPVIGRLCPPALLLHVIRFLFIHIEQARDVDRAGCILPRELGPPPNQHSGRKPGRRAVKCQDMSSSNLTGMIMDTTSVRERTLQLVCCGSHTARVGATPFLLLVSRPRLNARARSNQADCKSIYNWRPP